MDGNKKKMDGNKETSHQRRISDIAKKVKELSILSDTETFFLSFNPNGKAELVLGPNTNFEDMVNRFVNLSPKERYESKLEGIMGIRNFACHRAGTAEFSNLTEDIYPKDFAELGNMEQLKILKAAFETCIELIEKKKMNMSRLRESASASASASTSAVQHSAMNLPGPLNGNDLMNEGTNLLQLNMNPGSNSDDLLMAASPKDKGN